MVHIFSSFSFSLSVGLRYNNNNTNNIERTTVKITCTRYIRYDIPYGRARAKVYRDRQLSSGLSVKNEKKKPRVNRFTVYSLLYTI